MLPKASVPLFALTLFSIFPDVTPRERWRDSYTVHLSPRRLAHHHPTVLKELRTACPGYVCGNLTTYAILPLLSYQPECSQQDMADDIIDASTQFDVATRAKMVSLAMEYRQLEKNTPPDFTTTPPTFRNSVYCQKAPKNRQLIGLVQAQDPANEPDTFFDPTLQATVSRGSQPNTYPFRWENALPRAFTIDSTISQPVSTFTFSFSGTNPTATGPAVTFFVGDATLTMSDEPLTSRIPTSAGNTGICSTPQIEFGVGFDGRNGTSYRPVDRRTYDHDSAVDIDTIADFICNTLKNRCGADSVAQATCMAAKAAADAAQKGSGEQADRFNAVFGFQTHFGHTSAIDGLGHTISSITHPSNSKAPNISENPTLTRTSVSDHSETTPGITREANAGGDTTATTNSIPNTSIPRTNIGSSLSTPSTPTVSPTPSPTQNRSENLQTFKGALGGVVAPGVSKTSSGQYQVEGNSLFNNLKDALVRSCDVQNNQCADAANASGNKNGFTVAACNDQRGQCVQAAGS